MVREAGAPPGWSVGCWADAVGEISGDDAAVGDAVGVGGSEPSYRWSHDRRVQQASPDVLTDAVRNHACCCRTTGGDQLTSSKATSPALTQLSQGPCSRLKGWRH